MTIASDEVAGELSPAMIERGLFAVHFWAGDTRNHRYLRAQLEDREQDTFSPGCTRDGVVIPTRWAFRSELSQELGDDRDKARDCRACFRQAR
ncbi:hypothetical protein QRX50_30405 [Amycolatopsis carbonis]|uniref:Uncharacterized protein n=1 Tax=Amycolatopsis carbonis TaxID=715471 RepID=A0A9Y2IAY5_9PSEU|nr:hypothetical protein [Amycolatopsis sp. 2-15]WIX75780.1 hypothetical protein QRX50_30405 [Amycolatopsis sp. 2-15]